MRLIILLTILVICLFPTNILAQYPHKLSMCENIKDFNTYMEYSRDVNYKNVRYDFEPCDAVLDKTIENILNYKATFNHTPWYIVLTIFALVIFVVVAIFLSIIYDECIVRKKNHARVNAPGPAN